MKPNEWPRSDPGRFHPDQDQFYTTISITGAGGHVHNNLCMRECIRADWSYVL